MASPNLQIVCETDGSSHVLRLKGELDLVGAPDLEAAVAELCDSPATAILLDLEQLTFIDSTGLRAILIGRERCIERGCAFSLTPGKEQVRLLFELTGLLGILPFEHGASAGEPEILAP